MRTGKAGIQLIQSFEGCRLTAYRCPAGVPTIGYGHTVGVRMGQTITKEQAEEYLRQDLAKYEKKVEKYDGTYQWTQEEFDALVSFAYNIGSIDSLTASGTRSKEVIAEKILAYDKAGGKVLAGLSRRRRAERELFVKGHAKNETVNKVQYYPKYSGKSTLLVALKECGCCDTSLRFRKKIAKENGIVQREEEYTGLAEQNTKMLSLLKQGKLLKPDRVYTKK